MEEQKQEKKKFQKWPIVVLALLIVLVIGTTFAWYTLTKTSEKVNTIKAGSLSMVLDDEASDGILLQKAIPMSYQQGVATTEYTFTLKNNGSKGDYTISLKDEATYTNANNEQVTIEDTKRIADTKIRYILLKNGEVAEASKSMLLSEVENRVIDSGTIANGTTINYSLRIWIDSKASNEVMGQIFNARLQLNATQHQEKVTTVSFADDSWDVISANVKAGKGQLYTVGDTKQLMNNYTVRLVNTSPCTNGKISETACGFVVEFVEPMGEYEMNSTATNARGWPASSIRNTLTSFYSYLQTELKDYVADTKVVSGHGSTEGEDNFTSIDKLYLLSPIEVYGSVSSSSHEDTSAETTRQLDYYKNIGVTTDNYEGAIKYYNGNPEGWWLRSAASNDNIRFFSVLSTGCQDIDRADANLRYVAPVFRIA